MNVSILLFRNDLRIHDNPTLNAALSSKGATHLLPIYIFDPRQYDLSKLNTGVSPGFEPPLTWHFKLPKCGSHRSRFILESVNDLQKTLKSKGSNLLLGYGHPETIIPSLISTLKSVNPNTRVTGVYFQEEVTFEETDVEAQLQKSLNRLNVPIKPIWGSTVVHRDDLPFHVREVPDVYTQFRKRVEGLGDEGVRPIIEIPKTMLPVPAVTMNGPQDAEDLLGILLGKGGHDIDQRTAFPFKGGETAAKARVESYLWESKRIDTYKETRNGLVGSEYSSKLSPWLAIGAVSPRYVVHELRRVERARGSNDGTYWLWFELLWRDYFKFVALKYGNKIFHLDGFAKDKNIQWRRDASQFEYWKTGTTGIPWVDANMIELAKTGFMSNRGRQNVASFLTKDLLLDWRLGAEWFESLLLDHDPASNYLNWQYVAGVGNDPREDRRFNMIKQAKDYDPQGDYVKTWVGGLKGLGGDIVHTPWKAKERIGAQEREVYGSPIMLRPEWDMHSGRRDGGKTVGGNKGERARRGGKR